jgi:hypothetical protein
MSETETNPIEDLVNQITDGELNKAENSFNGLIQDKMVAALNAKRIDVASSVYGVSDGEPEDEDDIVDEVVEDETETDLDETETDSEEDIDISDEEIEEFLDNSEDETE